MVNKKRNTTRATGTVIATIILLATLGLSACSKKDTPAQKTPDTSKPMLSNSNGELSPLTADSVQSWNSGSEAGMSWRIPAGWVIGPKMPMRAGTYFAGATGGDADPAECRVNFFGAGQGGDVDANITRWVTQMEVEGQEGASPTPIVERTEVNGIPVAIVEISGVYLSKTRPMAKEFTRKSGYKMFAAIATAPKGTVFFKMTGPQKTMEANREKFRLMLGSVSQGS